MTNAESSYEGAVRRMRQLEIGRMPPPAFDLAGARQRHKNTEQDAQAARIRDLEELAALACEENERLEEGMARLREENASLQRRIAMLEDAIADPRTALGLTALPRSTNDELDDDELPTRGAWLRASLATVAIGLCGAATMAVAAGLLASDAGVLGVARLRSPVLGSIDGAVAMLDDAFARGTTMHPRYGRGLVPAGWAPTLPEPAPVAVPEPVVAAPVAQPVVVAPVHTPKPAHKHKALAKKAAPPKKAASLLKKAGKSNKDPLAGLDLL